MGFNYGYEKKKFDSRWKRLEVEYCDAGMSEEQIAAMKEYDWAWFCSQRVFQNHSETPRLVYMYQSALYLYNLERAYSPFNFYVVDTPNQQGQDTENLGSIFKSLELFLSDEGQVIVGTERETGMEEKASNVIKLTGKRRCLNNINYKKHIELLEKLQKTAISWVADNHNIQNEI